MTIHWCGTGLSAIPGLRELISAGHPVTVWNRTLRKAQKAVGYLTQKIKVFNPNALKNELQPGDIIVSMLPGDWHVPLAEMALSKGAHFISSSYISPEMRALDERAKTAGLALVNEVGLDPGIDHLMAHYLVEDYRAAATYNTDNTLSFISYCGGIPKIPNAFRYKFSWSPLGVLKALASPSRSLRNFEIFDGARPWTALSSYEAPLQTPETFEVYPNRDSLPFIQQYKFDPDWKVKDFVRGSLRLNGWADAWSEIFREIESLQGAEGERQMQKMSQEFWAKHAYGKDDPDRVVLCVSLKATRGETLRWHKTYAMDAWGDASGTAMARLVSIPVSLAVTAVLKDHIGAGVSAAPSDPKLVAAWLGRVGNLAQRLHIVDHT